MKVRILVEKPVGSSTYLPNQVVDLPSAVAKALVKEGAADDCKDAVDYCCNELGAVLIVHPKGEVVETPAATPDSEAV